MHHHLLTLCAFLLLGSTSCSGQQPIKPVAKWWTGSHSDRQIADTRIDWAQCATGIVSDPGDSGPPLTTVKAFSEPLVADLRVGAVVHTGSTQTLRDEFWTTALDESTEGRGPSDGSLLVSVVPYFEQAKQVHYLVPLVTSGKENIEAFVPTCTADVFSAFSGYPHYYTSVKLSYNSGAEGRKRLRDDLGYIIGANFEFLQNPVALGRGTLPRTMGNLLQPIFKHKKADFLVHRVSSKVQVRPLGLSQSTSYWVPRDVDGEDASRMSILLDLSRPSVMALRNQLVANPSDWAMQCDKDRRGLQQPSRDLGQDARFFVDCPNSPKAILRINGFKDMGDPSNGARFEIGVEKLVAKPRIIGGKDYMPAASQKDLVTYLGTGEDAYSVWDIPFRFFDKAGAVTLRLKKKEEGSSACVHIDVRGLLAKSKFEIMDNCSVDVYWPPAWGVPEKGCVTDSLDKAKGRCRVLRGDEATLYWSGLMEPVIITKLDMDSGKDIDVGKHLNPRLPFPDDDPWLNPDQVHMDRDGCEGTPVYRLRKLGYYLGADDKAPKREMDITGSHTLPGFNAFGWSKEQQLPEKIMVTLEQTGVINRLFPPELNIKWNPRLVTETQSLSTLSGKDIGGTSYTVTYPEKPTVAFDNGLEVHLYTSKKACRASVKEVGYWSYVVDERNPHTKSICDWARLKRNNKRFSLCIQGSVAGDGEHMELDFRPLDCGTGRRLIVIALSKQFDSIGRDLQKALLELLNKMKKENTSIPFDLLTINAESQVGRVASCEDLPDLNERGDYSIQAAITSRLRFRAEGLKALDDLGSLTVGPMFPANKIESLLYLTDGGSLEKVGSEAEIDRISASLRSPILDWQRTGVNLRVLTAGSCQTWKSMKVECEELPQDSKDRLFLIETEIDRVLFD